MPGERSHPTDQEFLRASDGELSGRSASAIRDHLRACWECRARKAQIESTIHDFVRAHREDLDPQLPPIEGSRALLKARLAEVSARPLGGSWQRFLRMGGPLGTVAYVCGMALVVAILGKFAFHLVQGSAAPFRNRVTPAGIALELEPDRKLTPGATRRVAIGEVCSMAHEEVVREVPAPLRQTVLREYGVGEGQTKDYEIDYLITPGLGGADDIHNLWPEPRKTGTWNARVKDDLEERLHEMVCSGTVDLPTAQREIATDWIGAYKKYFHTDKPLTMNSRLLEDQQASILPFLIPAGAKFGPAAGSLPE
jgi:hypothetical protein